MYIYLSIVIVLTLVYPLLMWAYAHFWIRLSSPAILPNFEPSTRLSVLVPARNEASNIRVCLQAIAQQNYAAELFEIILLDDHSEDETIQLAQQLNIPQLKILSLANFPLANGQIRQQKKQAIDLGVQQAKGDLIVCTDADCVMGPNWLREIAYCFETQSPKFIAGPVELAPANSLLERFQALDFLGMMAITAAGIHGRFMHMCNGANLAYSKAVFEEVGGFAGVDQLASGDDMLLLQKVAAQYPEGIAFLKQRAALVTTAPMANWRAFVQQRKRWASKSAAYPDGRTQLQLGLVWLFMLSMLITLILGFVWWPLWLVFLGQMSIKAVADWWLLSAATRFFDQRALLAVFFAALWLHWGYVLWVGLLGMLPLRFSWKGRRTK